MPLDSGAVGIEAGVFSEFIFELTGGSDGRKCCFNEEVCMKRSAGFGGEYLLSFDIEEEGFNGS